MVRGEGFEFFGFHKVDGKKLDRILYTADDFGGWWKQRRDRLVRYTDWLLGMLPEQVEDVNELLASFQPDVLVCDPMMWGPLLVVREAPPDSRGGFCLRSILPDSLAQGSTTRIGTGARAELDGPPKKPPD